MSAHEADSSRPCPDCGAPFDAHEWLSPGCAAGRAEPPAEPERAVTGAAPPCEWCDGGEWMLPVWKWARNPQYQGWWHDHPIRAASRRCNRMRTAPPPAVPGFGPMQPGRGEMMGLAAAPPAPPPSERAEPERDGARLQCSVTAYPARQCVLDLGHGGEHDFPPGLRAERPEPSEREQRLVAAGQELSDRLTATHTALVASAEREKALEAALRWLSNEVHATLSLEREAIVALVGVSNVRALESAQEAARRALEVKP